MTEISNSDNIIDSRDVIERIEELTAEWEESTGNVASDYTLSEDDWSVGIGEDAAREIVALIELASQGENYSDWNDGATLIRDDYFVQYAEELAGEIGAVNPDASWPLTYIDWESAAEALLQDYTDIEFDGVTYWVR